MSTTSLFSSYLICQNCIFNIKITLFHLPLLFQYLGVENKFFWVLGYSLKCWSFKSFLPPYKNINFLFASFKILPYFENAYWNPPLVIGWCSPVSTDSTPHWLQGKCELTFHRPLPIWFSRITGGFLFVFTVSNSPL